MIASREDTDVLAVTLTLIVALLEPEDLSTVHQLVLLLETVHDPFEVIVNVLLSEAGVYESLSTLNLSCVPSWVTFTCFVISPALTVMIASREDSDVLSVTLTLIVALSEPEDLSTVHQLGLLLVTVHDEFDLIVNVSLPFALVKDMVCLPNSSWTPPCVTLMR